MNQRDSEQQPKLDSGPFFLIYTRYRLELYIVHNASLTIGGVYGSPKDLGMPHHQSASKAELETLTVCFG